MSFGYIGYIWTLCGCAGLLFAVLGATGALYGWARRTRHREPDTTVEEIGVSGPSEGGGAA